jgi:hypothetical protein
VSRLVLNRNWTRYVFAVIGVALVPLHNWINSTTVALTFAVGLELETVSALLGAGNCR